MPKLPLIPDLRLAAISLAVMTSLAAFAEEKGAEAPLKLRTFGVLSEAANAAAAAANAAAAAANAATAAAAAANAAIDGINAMLPASQRIVRPGASPQEGATQTSESRPAGSFFSRPKTQVAERASVSTEVRFSLPADQRLSSLMGVEEIDVSIQSLESFSEPLSDGATINTNAESDLATAVGAGRSFSRELMAAEERLNQAKAQTGQARAALLPTLSVRHSTGMETSSPASIAGPDGKQVKKDRHHREDTGWTFRQAIFDLPGVFETIRRNRLVEARGESRRAADGDAYVTSVNAYLSLIATRLQADLSRDFEAQLKELLAYVEKRAKAGASSTADMARVRARSQAALSSLFEQESAHAAAGVEFVRLTNTAPTVLRLPVIEEMGVASLPDNPEAATQMALEKNPEISALMSEIEAANLDRRAAKSRFLPKLDVEYTDSKTLHAQGNPSDDGQKDRRLMLVMNWSIADGGRDLYLNRERAARHTELRYRLDDQRRIVAKTLSAHYATLRATRDRIETGYQELKSITIAAEAMSKRMLSGNQSLLDLLDTYERHYQAKARLVTLHVQEMQAAAQVVRLVHGTPPEIDIAALSKNSAEKPRKIGKK